ncbi:MAG: DUF2723 domain-containing protein [Candidatus Eisenbacteria bacterium]|nr:DUF2723 domain-containing protein [Candidatus Eisenbacteria bacterium]
MKTTRRHRHPGGASAPAPPAKGGFVAGAPLVFALAVLPPFAAYLATLAPGLPAGDSGELITAAWTFGVAHPPGYPLYVLLGGAWAHAAATFAEPALALNVFSAACMAAAAGFLALATRRLTSSSIAALFAAWRFALCAPAWKYAIVAEVFALNALLGALALWLFARALDETRAPASNRAMLALVFVTLLGFSHHHTLLLLGIPASIVAWIAAWRRSAGARTALTLRTGAVKLLALAPLAWLPYASHRAQALVWGDASTPRGFFSLLLRDDYGTFRLDPVQAGMQADKSHVAIWLESLPHGLGVAPLVLLVFGAFVLVRRAPRAAIALGAFVALQLAFFTRVGFPSDSAVLRGVIERFYILPALVLALLAGVGAAWALGRIARLPRPLHAVTAAALLALALAWPLVTLGRTVTQRGNVFAEALGRGMLASLPDRAVLFVQGDLQHNALAYLQRARGLRPDVTVLDQELMTYAWYVRRVRAAHPGLLPPLGAAQRVSLRDGRTVDGFTIPRGDSAVDLLTESAQGTARGGEIVSVRAVAPESAFATTRAGFRTGWLREPSDDRYSGLPGTRNLLWLDHLSAGRPVAFVGVKDDSWALRYGMTPVGFVGWTSPHGAPPSLEAQAAALLRVFAETPMTAYFRAYDETSFESAECARFASVVNRAALVLSQPQAAAAIAANPAGWGRMKSWAARFEALEPSPDPACLRAIGFLRVFGGDFADRTVAARDLERWLASGAEGAAADGEARAMLARLKAQPGR